MFMICPFFFKTYPIAFSKKVNCFDKYIIVVLKERVSNTPYINPRSDPITHQLVNIKCFFFASEQSRTEFGI